MSEADSRLLSEMFSMMQNLTRDVNDIKNEMIDMKKDIKGINKKLDEQSEMIEANFIDLKETQTVVEIHS